MPPLSATPFRLRAATDRAIGTTAFFRNRALYSVALEKLKASGLSEVSVLFHACSIGAEVYSFKVHYLLGGYDKHFSLRISALDLEQQFVDFATIANYPIGAASGMTEEEQSFFCQTGNTLRPSDAVLADIEYLPAGSYLDFTYDQTYDVVSLLNTLVYVQADEQSIAIDSAASCNTRLLLTSAFHMSTIKKDLERNGYQPVLTRQREIHNGWLDRRVSVWSDQLAPGIHANWRLPPFSKIDEFEYRYTAVFEKN